MAIIGFAPNDFISYFKLPAGTTVGLAGPGEAAAFSTSSLANFLGSPDAPFLILSSGIAGNVAGANVSGSQGFDYSPTGTSGDKVTLTFNIPKPEFAKAFTFKFTFLSEEFPEYVGSNFNDYLSIKINGVEVALDTFAKPITVNNNFFTSQYSPVGTFFDGQTPPLRITTPIDDAVSTVTVTIEVADVGDGIYDSAAFISSLAFAEVQIVYVEFDKAFLEFPSLLGLVSGFEMPASGLTEAQQIQVIDNANAAYKDFLIEFTQTKPIEGEYTTVHVGGLVSDLPGHLNASASLLGRAEHIDFGNLDKSDAAFVLAGEMFNNGVADVNLISHVLIHETGHLLGLKHVGDTGHPGQEMMYPFADADQTIIGGEENLVRIDNGNVVTIGGKQDSHEELVRNLGLRESTELNVDQGFYKLLEKFIDFDLNSSAPTMYGARLVAATQDNEIILVKDLGTVSGADVDELFLPLNPTDKIVLIGKSTPNGPFDLFLTPAGLTNFNALTATDEAILNALGIPLSGFGSGGLTLSQSGSNGDLSSVGTLTSTVVDVTTLTATDGPDSLSGTTGIDTLIGLDGDDTLFGLAGADKVFGNEGSDSLVGGAGDDSLVGGAGNDLAAYVGGASVTVDIGLGTAISSEGNDILIDVEGALGSSFVDTLIGNAGNNTLEGGGSADDLRGGDGLDIASYRSAGSAIFVDLGALTSSGSAGSDTFSSIEGIAGSEFGDTLRGDGSTNLILGGGGNDTAQGAGGDDSIEGGAGDDLISGGAGQDWLDGGLGNDTADYSTLTNALNIQLHTSLADAGGEGGFDLFDAIENAIAGSGDDQIWGNNLINVLTAGVGNDWQHGFGANDTLYGGDGSDQVLGGDGADTLYGGNGNDYFWMDNQDVVRGGAGEDFAYNAAAGGINVNLATSELEGVWAGNDGDTLDASGAAWSVQLIGYGARDTLLGGTGNDYIYFDETDLINGGPGGRDSGFAATGNAVTVDYAATGMEQIWATNANDLLNAQGFGGGAFMIAYAGSDTVLGGGGNDYMWVDWDPTDTVLGGTGQDEMYQIGLGGITLDLAAVGIEVVLASNVADRLDGSGQGQRVILIGLGGDDTLTGSASNTDVLYGGEGSDTLTGGLGNDHLFGGNGADTFVYSSLSGGSGFDYILDFETGDKILADTNVAVSGMGTSTVVLSDNSTLVAFNGHNWVVGDFG